jgi:polysaccharide transporter, PST family
VIPETAEPASKPPSAARRNLAWMLSGRVFQVIMAFGVGIMVTRYLGPDELGVLGFASAYAGLFTPAALIGSQVIVRDLAVRIDSAAHILGSAAALAFAFGSAAYLLAIGSALVLLDGSNHSLLLIAIIGSPLILAPLKAIEYWFEATLRAKFLTISSSTSLVLGAIARITVVAMGGGITAFAIVVAAEQVGTTLLACWFYWRHPGRASRWRVEASRVRSFAKESFPLLVAGLAIAVYMRIDQVMLGALSSKRQTGLYTAVVRLSEAPNFVAVSLAASFAPGLARLRAEDLARYQEQVSRMLSVLAALALAFAIPVALLSTPLIALVLGDKFDGAGPVLAIHVLSSLFVFVGVGQSVWTVNESLQRLAMVRTVAGAVINIALNAVLIPHHGAVGAAIATLVAYAFSAWLGNWFWASTRPMFWIQLRSVQPRRLLRVSMTELRSLRR